MTRALMTYGPVHGPARLPASTAASVGSGRPPPSPPAPAFDSSKAWEHLRQMVLIGPRPAGSAALRQTRAYITRQLAAVGLTVRGTAVDRADAQRRRSRWSTSSRGCRDAGPTAS